MTGKRGRPAGMGKTPGCGRKKGTPNKVTQLSNEATQMDVSDRRRQEVMDNLWEMTFGGSVAAALEWLALDDGHRVAKQDLKTETFDEIDQAAGCVTREFLKAKLTPHGTQRILDVLKTRRGFKEALVEPMLKQVIEDNQEQITGKKVRI